MVRWNVVGATVSSRTFWRCAASSLSPPDFAVALSEDDVAGVAESAALPRVRPQEMTKRADAASRAQAAAPVGVETCRRSLMGELLKVRRTAVRAAGGLPP